MNGRDVDDLALAAVALAQANELLAAIKWPVKIGADNVVPIIDIQLRNLAIAAADAGTVDEDVGNAELRLDFLEQLGNRTGLALIGMARHAAATSLFDAPACFCSSGAVMQICHQHIRAVLGEIF